MSTKCIFSPEEDKLLAELWPTNGSKCVGSFPGKTATQLRARVRKINVRMRPLREEVEQARRKLKLARQEGHVELDEAFLFTPNRRTRDLVGNLGGNRCVFVFDLVNWSGSAGVRISKPSAAEVAA